MAGTTTTGSYLSARVKALAYLVKTQYMDTGKGPVYPTLWIGSRKPQHPHPPLRTTVLIKPYIMATLKLPCTVSTSEIVAGSKRKIVSTTLRSTMSTCVPGSISAALSSPVSFRSIRTFSIPAQRLVINHYVEYCA